MDTANDSPAGKRLLTGDQLRELLSDPPVMFHSTGPDGRIRYHDGGLAQILGYTDQEFDQVHILDLCHPDFRAYAQRMFTKFHRTGSLVGEKMHMLRKDGQSVWMRLVANAIRDSEGRIIGSRSIVELIDERSRTLHELSESTLRFLQSAADRLDRLHRGESNYDQTQAEGAVDLTRRETEVLNLMSRGATNAAIAEQLLIAPSTVRFHVSNVLEKLGVRNRVEAAYYAFRAGLA